MHTHSIVKSVLLALLVTAFVLLGGALSSSWAYAAEARHPELLPGKKTLYQRVVSHPGAKLYDGPAQTAAVVKDKVKTFTAFYVYARKDNRVEVGVSASKADGWLDASATTVWPQAITMVFTDRMGRAPTLFFREHDELVKTCVDEQLATKMQQYADVLAKKTDPPANFPVIATEPSDGAVSTKNFYLLPVLNIDTQFGDKTKLLQVASIDSGLGGNQSGAKDSAGAGADPSSPKLRSGFVFVIDTTISMKPYIDQTLKLIRNIYDELEKNPNGEKFAFAVVAFRSSVAKSPKLGYTTQVVCDFKTVKQRKELEDALAKVEEATVSSHAFDEDSFAGVKAAVDSLNWEQFGSRIMLLISDAGPLRESDPTSQTGFSPKILADYLKANNIYLTVVHLKTPLGTKDHEPAQKAYMELSRQADNQASYIGLEATTASKGAAEFDAVGRRLAHGYSNLVSATAEGRFLPAPEKTSTKIASPQDEAARIAESTGYAMQLQFLGTSKGTRAPSVVEAWIADADLERLANDPQAQPVLTVTPAVLLTKTQLSQLREQLNIILQSARQSFYKDDAKNFFQSIQSAAALLSRDPGSFSTTPGKNLAQAGLLGEFLEGLPYQSRVMSLTEEDWYRMSTGEQKDFMSHLSTRIARYDEYDKDNTNWEGFGSPNRNEWVYRVPLDMLP